MICAGGESVVVGGSEEDEDATGDDHNPRGGGAESEDGDEDEDDEDEDDEEGIEEDDELGMDYAPLPSINKLQKNAQHSRRRGGSGGGGISKQISTRSERSAGVASTDADSRIASTLHRPSRRPPALSEYEGGLDFGGMPSSLGGGFDVGTGAGAAHASASVRALQYPPPRSLHNGGVDNASTRTLQPMSPVPSALSPSLPPPQSALGLLRATSSASRTDKTSLLRGASADGVAAADVPEGWEPLVAAAPAPAPLSSGLPRGSARLPAGSSGSSERGSFPVTHGGAATAGAGTGLSTALVSTSRRGSVQPSAATAAADAREKERLRRQQQLAQQRPAAILPVRAPASGPRGASGLSVHAGHILVCGAHDMVGLLLRALQARPPSPPTAYWPGAASSLARKAALRHAALFGGGPGGISGGGSSPSKQRRASQAAGGGWSEVPVVVLSLTRPTDSNLNLMHNGSASFLNKVGRKGAAGGSIAVKSCALLYTSVSALDSPCQLPRSAG
jgi:hypothetical protein